MNSEPDASVDPAELQRQVDEWVNQSRREGKRMLGWAGVVSCWSLVQFGYFLVITLVPVRQRVNEPAPAWIAAGELALSLLLACLLWAFVRAAFSYGCARRRWREAAGAAGLSGPGER